MNARSQQKGAALLIVLLLAATLSFIALAAMERTSRAAARSVNVNARSEALWRALAVETLALSAIEKIYEERDGKMSADDPWVGEAIELPLEDGAARVAFADATACFNLNALAQNNERGAGETEAAIEFSRLAQQLGVDQYRADAIAQAIGDWIDDDANRRPQGAEDEYYSSLPSPYRTGNQLMAAVSELRAVKGVNRALYLTLKPYLCALETTGPAPVNVNMLEERHAPILAAILGEAATSRAAADIIAARPPSGYSAVEAFTGQKLMADFELADLDRFQVTSKYLQARAEIVYDTAVIELTSDIAIEGGGARILARRIGAQE